MNGMNRFMEETKLWPVCFDGALTDTVQGWKFIPAEPENGMTYNPFEGYYPDKGGKLVSPRIGLDLPENAKFVLEIVDREHGNAIHTFRQLGCPEPPSGEETEILKRAAAGTVMKILSADGNGNLDLDIVLQPWSIASLRQL